LSTDFYASFDIIISISGKGDVEAHVECMKLTFKEANLTETGI
jgi:hypothetical protein